MRGPDQRPGQGPSISRPVETNVQYRARMLEQMRRADALQTTRRPRGVIESGSFRPSEAPKVDFPFRDE
jgi:hypothetical protein